MIRVFGSKSCSYCKQLVSALNKQKVSFIYVDADLPNTQDFCDSQKIDELPHVQILDKHKNLRHQWVGGSISPGVIKAAHQRVMRED